MSGADRTLLLAALAVLFCAPRPTEASGPAWGARLEPDPPVYISDTEPAPWLRWGADLRLRAEWQDGIRRPGLVDDTRQLARARLFLGIDPESLPMGVRMEWMDARQAGSDLPDAGSDTNHGDLLQGYLHFAVGDGELRLGRMTVDWVDRRQVGRNRWRNTINTFEGARWKSSRADAFFLRPVELRTVSWDEGDPDQWLTGVSVAADGPLAATWEPFLFVRRDQSEGTDAWTSTFGLHAFRLRDGSTGTDASAVVMAQWGNVAGLARAAAAVHAELGWAGEGDWVGRTSVAVSLATGQGESDGTTWTRFDRAFQPTHPYSMTDLLRLENLASIRVRWQARPFDRVRLMASAGAHGLASARDVWSATGVVDPEGDAGRSLFQDVEAQVRIRLTPVLALDGGVARVSAGGFASDTAEWDGGGTAYLAVSVHTP